MLPDAPASDYFLGTTIVLMPWIGLIVVDVLLRQRRRNNPGQRNLVIPWPIHLFFPIF